MPRLGLRPETVKTDFASAPPHLRSLGHLPQNTTRISTEEASPCRAGLLAPGLPGPLSLRYFAAGFLNRSSASVGFSVRLVSLASITGLSSTSVFSLCGYWTSPTGFQSP
jgi:hypothetical protein